MPTAVLGSADRRVNSASLLFCLSEPAEILTRGPEVLVGTKYRGHDMTFPDRCDNGKHMQMKQGATLITTPSEALTPPPGPERRGTNREERDKRTIGGGGQVSAPLLAVIPRVIYSAGLFAWLSLFCVSLLGGGRRDRFTWAGFFEVKMQTCSPL